MTRRIAVAAAQYPIEFVETFAAWRAKLARWVTEAAGGGAKLLVFPELGAMELSATLPEAVRRDARAEIDALQALWEPYQAAHREEAARHGVHILAASFPVRLEDGTVRNRAALVTPEGTCGIQDKLMMTRFEREDWILAGGDRLRVFDTTLGRLAVTICYDVEFPLIARAAVEAGADVLLAPSCTDTAHGFHRVAVGARARALENQCFVVTAPTVGKAPWSAAVDVNTGAAGVFAPPDRGFPEDGVLAVGERDRPGWITVTLDLDALAFARREGQVLNHAHWPEHVRLAGPAEVVRL